PRAHPTLPLVCLTAPCPTPPSTLSLHDALPISGRRHDPHPPAQGLKPLVAAQQGAQARGVDEGDIPHDHHQVPDPTLLQDGVDVGPEAVGGLLVELALEPDHVGPSHLFSGPLHRPCPPLRTALPLFVRPGWPSFPKKATRLAGASSRVEGAGPVSPPHGPGGLQGNMVRSRRQAMPGRLRRSTARSATSGRLATSRSPLSTRSVPSGAPSATGATSGPWATTSRTRFSAWPRGSTRA